MALRSPLVQLVMVRASAKLPVWASVVRVQVGVLVPKPARYQQSGTALASASASKPGFGARLASAAGAGGGVTAGFSGPPITWLTVSVVVPSAARGASHAMNCASSSWVTP